MKSESSELLSKIREEYNLEPMTDSNWKDYYNVLENYVGTIKGEEYTENIYKQHMQLRAFFDIYMEM